MGAHSALTQRQKAAVIVRLLLDDEDGVDLSVLRGDAQGLLAQEMAGMDIVDRATRDAVIMEFCDSLERVGLTFPGGLNPTLDLLGSRLSDDTTDRLRRVAALTGEGDPWLRLAALPVDRLTLLGQNEAVEIIALMLSKLPVAKASAVFTAMGAERGRAIARAMAMTGDVSPDALRRVGGVLLRAAEALPRPAIETPAAERVGAILNFATADIRDSVLEGLDQDDAHFAGGVRRAIFTFAHIPARVEPRDIPKIVRQVDPTLMLRALAGGRVDHPEVVEFILTNLSQRMAEGLREDMTGIAKVNARDLDEAMRAVITALRDLEAQGELVLILPEGDEDA